MQTKIPEMDQIIFHPNPEHKSAMYAQDRYIILSVSDLLCVKKEILQVEMEHIIIISIRDGQFRIPNLKDSNPKLSESNKIRLISCLQALSHCLFTGFLFVKVSIACNNSKTNLLTQTLMECVRFLMMHTLADII